MDIHKGIDVLFHVEISSVWSAMVKDIEDDSCYDHPSDGKLVYVVDGKGKPYQEGFFPRRQGGVPLWQRRQ